MDKRALHALMANPDPEYKDSDPKVLAYHVSPHFKAFKKDLQ